MTLKPTHAKKSSKKTINSDKTEKVHPSPVDEAIKGPHSVVDVNGVEVVILGTAHISRESVEDVKLGFEKLNPDGVAVELCQSRYDSMMDPDRWKKLDIGKVIKEKKLGLLASSLILSSFQKKIGESTGVKPGEEMRLASILADEGDKQLFLVDRDIRTTLSRAWGQVGFFSKLWLASNLITSLLVKEEIEPEEIERLKQEDVLTDLFSHLPARYEIVKRVIVDERDSYLADKIRTAARELSQNEDAADTQKVSKKKTAKKAVSHKKRLFAVVGAGHLAGITRVIEGGEDVSISALETVPPKSYLKTILYWMMFSTLVLVVSWRLGTGSFEMAMQALTAWIAGRSIASGVGAIIARAHPLTTLVTMITAPFILLIPGSRLWMFAALTEVWLKKPRVDDFENIAADTDDMKSFLHSLYSNRVLKLFWIITMVSMGLTLGNLFFWAVILGWFRIG